VGGPDNYGLGITQFPYPVADGCKGRQMRRNRAVQHQACRGQLDGPVPAFKERDLKEAFEFTDLPADGCLGDVEFVGSPGEAEQPGSRFERHQRCYGRDALAKRWHKEC
jgi:hypothetical protein